MRQRKYFRNVCVGSLSLFSILCVGGYIALSSTERVYASVGHVTMTSSKGAVVYGKATLKTGNRPVAGVQVTVRRRVAGQWKRAGGAATTANGLYRIATVPGLLDVGFKLHGHSADLRLKLKPGQHAEVRVRVTRGATISFLPIVSY